MLHRSPQGCAGAGRAAHVTEWVGAARGLPRPSLGLSQALGLIPKPFQLAHTAEN